ncbi:MAG TPA: family 10 glycosylhydrolase, partial [Longimicrobiaceae bacterium]|nr:family 10 glycosylhydrolase [Longimicrobiaceae bacterium]
MHRLLRTALAATAILALASCSPADAPTAPGGEGPGAEKPGVQSALGAEGRALWVNRFEYDSPTKIATIMQKAADANFNVVFFQVRGSGDAYYRSALEPCAVGLCGRLGGTPTWDPLEVAVREAHARGLQLHAWLNALTGWGSGSSTTCSLLRESDAGNPRHMLLAHPDWKVVNSAGTAHPCPNNDEYVYLSPGNPG